MNIDVDASHRACLGRSLAIMQLHIIFATLFRRYDFTLKSDAPVSRAYTYLITVADFLHQLEVRDSLARRALECIIGIKPRK